MAVSGMPPLLVMVTDCAAESWPTGVVGKASEAGAGRLRVSVGGVAAIPLSWPEQRERIGSGTHCGTFCGASLKPGSPYLAGSCSPKAANSERVLRGWSNGWEPVTELGHMARER